MKYPVAFQVWQNGGIQTSGIYDSTDPDGPCGINTFVARHEKYREEGNNLAHLVVCETAEQLKEWEHSNNYEF